ncbi:MAG: aspartate aminotransferase family protein [Clostridiales bacterium]|nr:aspartate aminotransferase family protein [Clostridiales bacterium]
MVSKDWCKVDIDKVPDIKAKPPGPKSLEMWDRVAPYMQGFSTPAKTMQICYEKSNGMTVTDVDGNEYIDFAAGVCVANCGHNHPKVKEAMHRQLDKMINAHDFVTESKVALIEKLQEIALGDLRGVQLYCSGAEAVEYGLRTARAVTGRSEFMTFYKDFHGKTPFAKSLGNVDKLSGPRIQGFYRVPYAHCYRCSFKMKYPECGLHCADFIRESIFELSTGQIAAIVAEPVQGFSGSVVPAKGFMKKIRELCDELGILMMVDEVASSFGRTGTMFACEHDGVVPDIMTIGKGFGNGAALSGVLYKQDFVETAKKISTSTTHGGNPLACAAATAAIDVILEEGLVENSARVGETMFKQMEKIMERHPLVGDVRGKGLFLGMEIVKDRESKEPFPEAGIAIFKKAFEKGVAWIPANENLRITPPLIMTEEVALKGLDIIEEAIYEVEEELRRG